MSACPRRTGATARSWTSASRWASSPGESTPTAVLKFLLLSYDLGYGAENNASLPMYRPYLEQLEEDAEAEGRMAPEDTARFEDFLASVENSTLCDETALGMICEEAASYFAGACTAEEAARVIQERLSIYVAEQS